MRPTPFRLLAGTSATCAVALIVVSSSFAQLETERTAPKVAQGASLLGGALPGGAILSSAVVSLTPAGAGGGAASAAYAATGRAASAPAVTCPIAEDGTFSFKGLKPGAYEFRISFPAGPRQSTSLDGGSPATDPNTKVTVPKQTQGATFGEKVNAGLATAGNSKTKHDTAKNSIGNIRAREETQAGGVSVAAGDVTGDGHATDAPAESSAAVSSVSTMAGGAGGGAAAAAYAKENINSGMPNRISMNVTVPKQNFAVIADGDPVVVQVDADGTFAGRASVQAQQGAQPVSSGRTTPDPAAPSGGTPPRPTGG
ncbi:MAG TPA: hypothetical protein VMM36_06410 [Opitutaceae bacterium]|nr:hypothetical protein [Opitutaceae bacterium]